MNRRPVQERIEEFKEKNPEATSMLLVYEMKEIWETGNAFDMIMNAFFLGYMKGIKKKGGDRS